MTVELAHYEGQVEHLSPAVSDPTGGRLVAWAEGLSAAHRIGAALCQTAFVPAHFKNKPEEAAAAILYGDEIGLTPTQALQNLYVISGKPALYARAMVALVLAAGHEVWTVSKSDAQVTVAGRRRGSSHVIEETWTTARASKAGYTNNKKYSSDPQAMLYARAAADVCRQVAPDALAGLAYSVEESELDEPQPTTRTVRTERATTAKRSAPVVPEPEVVYAEPIADAEVVSTDLDDAPVASEPTTTLAAQTPRQPGPFMDNPDGAPTDAQTRMLGALLRGQTREQALALVSSIVGREVQSRKDLSKRETSAVIDALKKAEGAA